MHIPRWRAGPTALLLAFLALTGGCTNGDGPLRSASDGDITIGFNSSQPSPASTGFQLCTSGTEVRLVSVEPIEIQGDVRFLGAMLLTGGESPIGTASGFPPDDFAEHMFDLGEELVDTPCNSADPSEFAQVVIGIERTGNGGGSLRGFRVVYEHTSSRQTLEVDDFDVELCGTSGEFCDA